MVAREASRWVSYEDAAVLLGLPPDATRRLALRHGWPRRTDPLGRSLVSVPETLPEEGTEDPVFAGEAGTVHGATRALIGHLELRVEQLTQELAEARTEMRGVRYEAESLRVDAGRVTVFAALVEAERARSAEFRAERDRLAEDLTRERRPWLRRLVEDVLAITSGRWRKIRP